MFPRALIIEIVGITNNKDIQLSLTGGNVVNALNAAIQSDADRSMGLDQACLGIDDLRWPAAQSFWITSVQNDAATSH